MRTDFGGDAAAGLLEDEHVVGLQVPVHDAMRVQVRQPAGHLCNTKMPSHYGVQ